MKKKALIATIFIGVTGLVLAGYFVGCGQQQPDKSQVATKDSAQKLDLEKEDREVLIWLMILELL